MIFHEGICALSSVHYSFVPHLRKHLQASVQNAAARLLTPKDLSTSPPFLLTFTGYQLLLGLILRFYCRFLSLTWPGTILHFWSFNLLIVSESRLVTEGDHAFAVTSLSDCLILHPLLNHCWKLSFSLGHAFSLCAPFICIYLFIFCFTFMYFILLWFLNILMLASLFCLFLPSVF